MRVPLQCPWVNREVSLGKEGMHNISGSSVPVLSEQASWSSGQEARLLTL